MKKIYINKPPTPFYLPIGLFDTSLNGPYYYHSLEIPILKNYEDDGAKWLSTDWGTLLILLSVDAGALGDSLPGYCAWLRGASMTAENAMTILVIDFDTKFDIDKLAPQFIDIERASYMTYDPETGAEIFRVMFPLRRPISLEKFLTLKPTIQKWVDGEGDHPLSNLSSYQVGRFCGFPSYRKAEHIGPRVVCTSPGYMLDEGAFDELMNTGVLTLV